MVWRQIDGRWQNVKDSEAPLSSPNEVNKPNILIQSLSSPGMPQSLPVRPTIKKGGELEEVGGADSPVVVSPSVSADYNKTTDFVSSKKLIDVVKDMEAQEDEEGSSDIKPTNLFSTTNDEPVKEEDTKNVLTIPLQKDESDLQILRAKIDEYVTQRETDENAVTSQGNASDVLEEDKQPSTTTEEAGGDDLMPTNVVEEVEQLLPAAAADNDDEEEIEEQLLTEEEAPSSDKEEADKEEDVPQDNTLTKGLAALSSHQVSEVSRDDDPDIEEKNENEDQPKGRTDLTKGLAALSGGTNQVVGEGREDDLSTLPEAEPTEPDVYERESEIVREEEGSSTDQLDVGDNKSTAVEESAADEVDMTDDKPLEDTPQATENKSDDKSTPNNPATSMKQLKEDVEKLRDRYNQSITESGEESYESINAGICLATALHKTRQITQAERLLEQLALISRRTYGFDNDLTQIVESNLQNVKIRYVCVESEVKTSFYQALKYDDDGTTLVVHGPLNGPLAAPLTNIPDSDIKSFQSKDVIPGPGTPVICYKPGHKKGRVGEVRTREEAGKLKVQFADKSIRTLMQENVRVLFELPVKEPPAATKESVLEKKREEKLLLVLRRVR